MLVADVAESVFCLHRFFFDVVAVDENLAFGIGQYTRDALEGRRFACSVVSEKSDDFAGITGYAQIIHGGFGRGMVLLREIFYFKTR